MWEINFQLFLMYRTLLAFKEHALFFFVVFSVLNIGLEAFTLSLLSVIKCSIYGTEIF